MLHVYVILGTDLIWELKINIVQKDLKRLYIPRFQKQRLVCYLLTSPYQSERWSRWSLPRSSPTPTVPAASFNYTKNTRSLPKSHISEHRSKLPSSGSTDCWVPRLDCNVVAMRHRPPPPSATGVEAREGVTPTIDAAVMRFFFATVSEHVFH